MSQLQTVKQNWEDYFKACYSKGQISDVQLKETKQAFYCGTFTMIGLLGHLTPLPEDTAVAELEKLYKEVEDEISNQILKMMQRHN